MVEFLRGMTRKQKYLADEKKRLLGTIETMEQAIERNTFSRKSDDTGIVSSSFSPDKIFRILLDSQRDIEEETKNMVLQMRDIYIEEAQIDYVRKCLLQMNGQDQQLIQEVYINDVVVDRLTGKMNLSKSSMYRMLQRAVERLLDLYNMSCNKVTSAKANRLIQDVMPYMPEGSIA